MDESKVRAIVIEAAETMQVNLALREWDIRHYAEKCPNDSFTAQCRINTPYHRAFIWIDPAGHEAEDDVLDSLRHELLHLVGAEWEVYATMIMAGVEDSETMQRVEDRACTLASERTVSKLEKMLDGLGVTPRRLAGMEEEA